MSEPAPLLEVRNLKTHFPIKKGVFRRQVGAVRAVDDVSFVVYPGETLGLVGESGCGKTTLGRTIVRLLEPTEGEILFDGKPIGKLGKRALRPFRRELQMVFQDPYSSLNPRKRVRNIVGAPLKIHGVGNRRERRRRVSELLESVGLSPEHANRFPHQFSGGQRQRIGIARALALRPKLIVADEPVSALDVSIQAQIVNLLEELQDEFSLTYIVIAHDLGLVRHVSDRIAVMYLGRIVELSPAEELYTRPIMPYTEALLSAVPIPNPDVAEKRERILLRGDVGNPGQSALGLPVPPALPVRDRDLLPRRAAARLVRQRPLRRVPPPAQRRRHTAAGELGRQLTASLMRPSRSGSRATAVPASYSRSKASLPSARSAASRTASRSSSYSGSCAAPMAANSASEAPMSQAARSARPSSTARPAKSSTQ